MADISCYVIFCDSFRNEIGGKSTIVGTYGAAAGFSELPSTLGQMSVVAMARVCGLREVETTFTLELEGANAAPSPRPISSKASQDPEDTSEEWQLQMVAELQGMPIDENVVLRATFEVNGDYSATSRLKFVHQDTLAKMTGASIGEFSGETIRLN